MSETKAWTETVGFTLLLAALAGLTALGVDMSLPALPALQEAFGADVAAVQLTLGLFMVGYGVGQVISGPLSDAVGRRPVLLGGVVVFTGAGFAASGAASLPALVGVRLAQGLGASVGPTLTRAIVRDLFTGREGSGRLSQITQVMVLAPMLAPLIGGYVLLVSGWRSIFLLLGTLGAAIGVAAWRRLPETLPPAERGDGGRLARVLGGYRAVAGHAASVRFILAASFSYAAMFAYVSGSPFVFIEVFGVPEQHFGFLFALTAISLLAGATLNRRLVARHSPESLLRGATAVLLAAGVLLPPLAALRLGGAAGVASVLGPMMLYMAALGVVQPNAMVAAMAGHPRTAGVVSSLIGGLQTLLAALAGYLVGLFYAHDALSLALTVAAGAVLTAVFALPPHRLPTPEPAAKEEGEVEVAMVVNG